jgi:hypothetical protein
VNGQKIKVFFNPLTTAFPTFLATLTMSFAWDPIHLTVDSVDYSLCACESILRDFYWIRSKDINYTPSGSFGAFLESMFRSL